MHFVLQEDFIRLIRAHHEPGILLSTRMATGTDDDGARFVERKFLDFQRSSARRYVCPYCEDAFVQDSRLWEHAKKLHWDALQAEPGSDEEQLRKRLRTQAVEKAQFGSPQKIHDFGKLTLGQPPGSRGALDPPSDAFSMSNPLKRRPTENLETSELDSKSHAIGHTASARRREKARSCGSLVVLDPDDRTRGERFVPNDRKLSRNSYSSTKRVYNPHVDDINRATGKPPSLNRETDPVLPIAQKTREIHAEDMALDERDMATKPADARQIGHLEPSHQSQRGPDSQDARRDIGVDLQPQMLLQPETRPISHAQLVVEVKGIYHGLVMVEQKCIEVDEKQLAAALERDPSKKTDLKDGQWQALTALHKTLLHEHHDFFLASQHPSASPPLSKLASKYTMPARMWRHGIHAFLEVLRHRLPASLDHMLAFIYIAYSMMALLYETVTTFEDTWIECLGDLARYRMAIEDSNTGDREIWGAVARSWYNKAADRRPGIGRLYHHLAILARPFSLSQLAYYTRSLSSVEPFDSARGSVMALFQPVLDGKTFSHHRMKALELAYIKMHGVLFDRPQDEETFRETLISIQNGLLDAYIDRITSNFKEQGLYIATANIAGLFQYGGSGRSKVHRSLFWLAFMDVKKTRDQLANPEVPPSTEQPFSLDGDSRPASPMSPKAEKISSLETTNDTQTSSFLSKASELAFSSLSITLRRHGDKNVFPFVHCMFVFLWNLASIESIMRYVQEEIPWNDICSFLNTLAKQENMTPAVLDSDNFPKSGEKGERPLPEDFFMRGQLFALDYLHTGWCENNLVDEEERMLELPSMTATRVERLLWLGVRMAK
ncbi:MAG: hypothetical protein Q9192_004692, partial [Flavoplaca navasiana]